jgi:hypothetical protein
LRLVKPRRQQRRMGMSRRRGEGEGEENDEQGRKEKSGRVENEGNKQLQNPLMTSKQSLTERAKVVT